MKVFRAALAFTSAFVMVSGCSSTETLRRAGDALTLPSLYGNFQEARAARGTRGEDNNPCHFDRRVEGNAQHRDIRFSGRRTTRTTDEDGANSRAGENQTEDADEIRFGAFREWCRAALAAEVGAGNVLVAQLTGGTTPDIKPQEFDSVADFANQRYLDAGIALSNQLCEGYFQRMGLSDAALTFSDGLISDLGTAASGVQSLTGVAQGTIGVTSAALGLVGSTVRNGRENFAFDGNIDSVYFLVRTHRRNHEATIRQASEAAPDTFWRVHDWLNGYHASCSYMAIRVMVDEAINRRTAEATAGPQNRVLTLSEQERGELSQTLELKTVLSDADIVAAIALDLEPSRAAVIALMPGFVDTQLERVSGEPNPINLTAFFGDRVNRQRLTGALLADDLGTYGAYLALARTALQTRSFAGETPAPAPTPAPTESTPQPESPLPPPAQ